MRFAIVFLLCLLAPACYSQDRPILDRWQANSPAFSVRVTEYQEKHFPLSKFCYVFESNAKGSSDWHEIMTTRTDEDISIPREHVRFLGDRIAYVFMVDQYAITTDAGASWSIWSAEEGAANLKQEGQYFIKEVLLNPDGSGMLVLTSNSPGTQTLQFLTADFGRKWKPK